MKAAHASAVAVGLLAYLTVKYIQPDLQTALIRVSTFAPYSSGLLEASATIFLRTVLVLVPGFATGLMAPSRGVLLGFAVGAFGGLLSQLVFIPSIAQSPPVFSYQWSIAVSLDISAGILSAAGAAVGQLVRSNKSLERTRER
jgi:hypothetical protein